MKMAAPLGMAGMPIAPPKKKKLPPFVSKLYAMVEDPATNNIISWGDLTSQDSFVVHRVEDFTTDILPLYFKHSNFCSFIRQVNTYGFTKTSPDTWEFQNPFFAQGKRSSLLLDSLSLLCTSRREGVYCGLGRPPMARPGFNRARLQIGQCTISQP